jgi:hypothetical protein
MNIPYAAHTFTARAASSTIVTQSCKEDSSLFTFMYFRSSTRRRFPLQFDLIVINGGADEIF